MAIMKFMPLLLVVLIYNHGVWTHKLQGLEDSTVEEFPYQVAVKGTLECSGILIAENLVITPVICVQNASSVSVYVGFNHWPFLPGNTDHNTKIYTSTDVVVHEDFRKLNGNHYVNHIALIRLPHSVTMASNVRPGKLIAREEAPEVEQKLVNMSGWVYLKNLPMQTKPLRVLNQDTCSDLFGNKFLRSQELCAKTSSATTLYIGNAVTWNKKIIGYLLKHYDCVLPNSACGPHEIILNLVPYLDWISENGNISIGELTGRTRENNLDAALKKMENLEETNKKLFGKLEQNIANINQKLEDAIKNLQEVTTEISNASTRETINYKNYREEINQLNVELKSIVNNQKNGDIEFTAKCDRLERNINFLSNEIKSVNESITEIRDFINDPIPN